MVIEPKDMPVHVFRITLALLLTFCAFIAAENSLAIVYCNLEVCPSRFDIVSFIATFVLTGGFALGIASVAYVTSKKMVKAVWKNVKFPDNRF